MPSLYIALLAIWIFVNFLLSFGVINILHTHQNTFVSICIIFPSLTYVFLLYVLLFNQDPVVLYVYCGLCGWTLLAEAQDCSRCPQRPWWTVRLAGD